MENKSFTFSTINKYASEGITQAIKNCNVNKKTPIIICIGSDLVLGDSLGPLVGTLLKKMKTFAYVYGTLNYPITAKEVEYAKTYLKQMHPTSLSIAIDAAVGAKDEVGLIKVVNKGLKPGLGVNKKLGEIGDVSIIGIVAEKTPKNYDLYNLTRLNLIYKMSEAIADGINNYVKEFENDTEKRAI